MKTFLSVLGFVATISCTMYGLFYAFGDKTSLPSISIKIEARSTPAPDRAPKSIKDATPKAKPSLSASARLSARSCLSCFQLQTQVQRLRRSFPVNRENGCEVQWGKLQTLQREADGLIKSVNRVCANASQASEQERSALGVLLRSLQKRVAARQSAFRATLVAAK